MTSGSKGHFESPGIHMYIYTYIYIFVDLIIDHIMFIEDGQEMAEFLYESSYFGIFCLTKLDSCILNLHDFRRLASNW